MRHHRTVLPLAGYTIQQIDFDPATFQPEDLFWLPYHASLTGWGRKRQAEHRRTHRRGIRPARGGGETASRHRRSAPAAVAHALVRQHKSLRPARAGGDRRSAGGRRYRAPVYPTAGRGAGEQHYQPGGNGAAAQRPALPLALTLAFSAKESGFKAWSSHASGLPGFHSARIVALTTQQIHLRFTASFSLQLADFPLQINHLIKDDLVITCTCPTREA